VNVPRFAVTHKSLVLVGLALAVLWSSASFLTMQRREDPQVLQRRTEILTLWPGASTENVEQLITKKIADEVRGVDHVEHVEGSSHPGVSDIAVFFDDRMTDAEPALRDVRNRIDDFRGRLPAGIVGPTLEDDIWKTYPIVLGITLEGSSPRRLRDFATTLKDGVSALPDVGVARLAGQQEQSVDVGVDLRKLDQYGFTAGDVTNALAAHNAIVPSGSVALGDRSAQVDPSEALHDAAGVGAVTVAAPGGRIVQVSDVADVQPGYPDPPAEIVRVNGRPGVALAIQTKETASLTVLGGEVRAYLARVRASCRLGPA
jgi:multidrug efflux pump subunit AcrB